MAKAPFAVEQRSWQWWDDDAAEPTSSKESEDTAPTLSSSTEVCRLRVAIGETGGESGNNNILIDLQYSTNESDWYDFGPSAHWDYYNGQATEGNIVSGLKIGDSNTAGEYSESSGGSGSFDFDAGTITEFDICIQQTENAGDNTLYYFRVLIDSTEVVLGSGEIHPRLTTAAEAAHYTLEAYPNQTFALTGVAASLYVDRKLNASPNQAFTLSGISTGLYVSRKLDASPQQTFSLTGVAASLVHDKVLDATTPQAFALTGNAINLLMSRILNSQPQQTFTHTGFDVNLRKGRTLVAEYGTFILTGVAANLIHDKILSASPQQTFILTGILANLLYNKFLSASPQQTFILSGNDANFLINLVLTANPGAFVLTGNDIIFTYLGHELVGELTIKLLAFMPYVKISERFPIVQCSPKLPDVRFSCSNPIVKLISRKPDIRFTND